MLPIQKSQFLAQCRAYIRLNDQLTWKLQELVEPPEATQYIRYNPQAVAIDAFRESYFNRLLRNIHNPSVQELNQQMEAIVLPSIDEPIEVPQVHPPTTLSPNTLQEETAVNAALLNYYSEKLCSIDVQIAFLQQKQKEEECQISQPAAISSEIASEAVRISISPLLEDNITGDWNLDTLFDCVSESDDSSESLVIDTDYDSEREKGN